MTMMMLQNDNLEESTRKTYDIPLSYQEKLRHRWRTIFKLSLSCKQYLRDFSEKLGLFLNYLRVFPETLREFWRNLQEIC